MLDTVLLARDKWLKPTGCGKIFLMTSFRVCKEGEEVLIPHPRSFSKRISHHASRLQKLINLRFILTLSINFFNLHLFQDYCKEEIAFHPSASLKKEHDMKARSQSRPQSLCYRRYHEHVFIGQSEMVFCRIIPKVSDPWC